MARAAFVLLLPLLFLSISGDSSEYYIAPTNSPANISCPVHSCLTISQYANISSNHLTSNSVLYLLPGIHVIEQPIVFRGVHNLSIIGLHSFEAHIHAFFHSACHCSFDESIFNSTCSACGALQFWNVSDITIEGFRVTVESTTSNDTVGALSFADAHNISIANMTIHSNDSGCWFGISVITSHCINIYHSKLKGSKYGVIFSGAQNIIIDDVSVYNSDYYAVRIRNSSKIGLHS